MFPTHFIHSTSYSLFQYYVNPYFIWASQIALVVKNPRVKAGRCKRQVQCLNQEDPMEAGTTTHSSILAWKTPWTEEPGRLQAIGHTESDMIKET